MKSIIEKSGNMSARNFFFFDGFVLTIYKIYTTEEYLWRAAYDQPYGSLSDQSGVEAQGYSLRKTMKELRLKIAILKNEKIARVHDKIKPKQK